jgi:hypothetical protein
MIVLLKYLPGAFFVLLAVFSYAFFAVESTNTVEMIEASDPISPFDTIKTDLRDYSWPTDASTRITSTFAEYRSTHFHGGIDISTNGTTGHNVFATRDGYVSRIRIDPTGYGKMLYVTHRDGYTSTYAHLKGFVGSIAKAANDEQCRVGRYRIDLVTEPNQLPVRKGDLIAYSGDTGFGPPHLHFEIRDENLNPVNPMLCEHLSTRDNVPPTIDRIAIFPLGADSRVDGQAVVKLFSRFSHGSHGRVSLAHPIRVHGSIGFGVDARDRSDGVWNSSGIHRIEFYLGDSLAYAMQLDRVPADESKQIHLHYDLPAVLDGKGRFQKLYIEEGNILPFYGKSPSKTGIINTHLLTEGELPYRIVCADNNGNQTELRGSLIINHTPTITIESATGSELLVRSPQSSTITKWMVLGKKNQAVSWTQHTFQEGRFERRGDLTMLPIDLSRYDVLKIQADTRWESRSAPVIHFVRIPTGEPSHPLKIESEVLNDFVRLTVSTSGVFTDPPKLMLLEGGFTHLVLLEAVEPYRYTGSFVPADTIVGRRLMRLTAEVNGGQYAITDSLFVYPISPRRAGTFFLPDRNVSISFDSGAVFKPVYLRLSSDQFRNSTLYTLEPRDVLLNRGIRVALTIPEELNGGALYFRSTGGWFFQTAQPDPGSRKFSTLITRVLGDFVILKDVTPPFIANLRVSARRGIPTVSFSYRDDFSGVDTDETFMYIDDGLVIPEIDGEHRRITYQSDRQVPRGKHRLKIVMKDRAGNATEFTRTFTVQ